MELNDLIQMVASYTDVAETETLLTMAYQIASDAHRDFRRMNGEPFLNHPLAVAAILAEWHAPPSVVIAGLLHDIHSPDYSHGCNLEEIQSQLGPDISRLLDSVISLNSFIRYVERDIHNEADAKEVRYHLASFLQRDRDTLVIKIADRLHNLQTISALTRYFQERTADIGFKLLSPLAGRLGMDTAKRLLEDSCFEINNPDNYRILQQRSADADIQKTVHSLLEEIRQVFEALPHKNEVRWQPASFYALYRQQIMQNAKLDKRTHVEPSALRLVDVGSFIILTEEESECYRILGMIHKLYPPVEGQFRDFIANPKENGYQSLHTQVKHPSGSLQVTIRTHLMDIIAEYGVTARWWNVPEERLPQLPKENKPIDGEMQVFTPKGEIKYLPHGATVLDFAYHIHSDVGHHCAGALVNSIHEELHKPLKTGDMVEIIDGGVNTEPNLVWLDYVRSQLAVNRIRQWLSQHQRNAMAERGRMLLDGVLQPLGLSLADAQVHQLLAKLASHEDLRGIEDLLVLLGVGRYQAPKLVKSLKSMRLKSVRSPNYVELDVDINVLSAEEAQLPRVLAQCCRPVPSDEIVGYQRKDGILAIHKRTCLQIREAKKLIQVQWGKVPTELNYVIVVEALNRPGLASDVSTIVAMLGLDMQSFSASKRPDGIMAEVHIYLGKTTATQRGRIQKTLEGTSYVTSVEIIHSSFFTPPPQKVETSRSTYFSNPYGPRLAEGSRFYGRTTACERISALLRDQSHNTAILLWGQRRIGKTSFVLRLREYSQGAFLPIYLDVQGLRDSSTTQFLHELMNYIAKGLPQWLPDVEHKASVPQFNRIKRDPLAYFDAFMAQIQEIAHDYPLVVILDEFQCLCSLREEKASRGAIFSRLRSHAQHGSGIHFILSGGGLMSQLTHQCEIETLFNITYDEKLGCLEEKAARQLIKDGLSKVGSITDLAIDLLIDFTSGHPFYLQLLCSQLFEQAQENNLRITQDVVSHCVLEWLAKTDNSRFQHFWEGHDSVSAQRNKLLLSAIAELGTHPDGVEYNRLVSKVCPTIPEQALIYALDDLTKLGVLKRYHSSYAIVVTLFVRWLRRHSPLELALQEARWQ